MTNPAFNQITRNAILLQDGDSSMPEGVCRALRYSDLFAQRLQNIAIHIPADQWSSVATLEDSSTCTIAQIILNDRHCIGVYVHFSVAGFTLGSHFLMHESAPSDINHQLLEVQILNVKTSHLSESHSCSKLECE